jgi:hypothetical protein
VRLEEWLLHNCPAYRKLPEQERAELLAAALVEDKKERRAALKFAGMVAAGAVAIGVVVFALFGWWSIDPITLVLIFVGAFGGGYRYRTASLVELAIRERVLARARLIEARALGSSAEVRP